MRMAAVAAENTFSEQMENIPWNDLRLGEWESEETDLNERCYREDFLQESKLESEKSIWDSEKDKVCSMCQAWQDVGDGFRFHLPKDIFTASSPESLNAEKNEKLGDIDIEENEKNYCKEEKEEENEEDPVVGKNQVAGWKIFKFKFAI